MGTADIAARTLASPPGFATGRQQGRPLLCQLPPFAFQPFASVNCNMHCEIALLHTWSPGGWSCLPLLGQKRQRVARTEAAKGFSCSGEACAHSWACNCKSIARQILELKQQRNSVRLRALHGDPLSAYALHQIGDWRPIPSTITRTHWRCWISLVEIYRLAKRLSPQQRPRLPPVLRLL